MLYLAQFELDDCERAIEDWLDVETLGDPINRRQRLIEALDRVYEICQAAHARELKVGQA